MYISLLWLVLSSICVRSWACVTDSDCPWTSVCCDGHCYRKSSEWIRCYCGSSDECRRDERCYYGRCEPIPTVSTTTTTTARPTRDGDCKNSSDCGENEYCYRGRFGRSESGFCTKRRDLEEEERQKRKKELERNLLNIGLPIGIPFLIMPCLIYFTLKYLNKRERRRYGIPYRSPARTPQRSQAGATGQPRNSQATEMQPVSTGSSHNDRTVIVEVHRLAPSAPQLPAPQNIPTEEVMESTEPEEQTDTAVSSETVIDNSSSLVPGAPPSYNEIRRLQNGDTELPPPSYEEAVVNYNIV